MLRVLLTAPLLFAVTGCAWLFHKPRPDLELPMAERPWRVRCEWVLPPSPEPDAAPGPGGSRSAWASDTAGRRLVLDGRLEDGFFVVSGVRAASDDDDRDVAAATASAAAVTEACGGALARDEEAATAQLVGVAAVRDGEGIEVPLVFADDPARPRPVSRLVVFGDSLSDDGNLKRRLLVFPSTPYWLGRFSNGPNWTDHFGKRTGIAVQNHAYGGAAAIHHDEVPSEDVVAAIQQGAQFFLTGSIDGQVKDYLERDLAGGVVQQPRETLYLIFGGANDYISKEPFSGDISTLLDDPESEAGYRRVVDEAVLAIADQVRRLHAAGARQFAVVNLPNLGLTPIAVENESYRPRVPPRSEDARRLELARKLGGLTTYHNRQLRSALTQLARELPDARIVPLNAAQALYRLLESLPPEGSRPRFDYGFALRPLARELRAGGRSLRLQDRCFDGGYLGTADPTKVCPESKRAIFWDVVHPTSYTHCWMSFFLQRDLAKAGLLAEAPSAEEHRAYCQREATTSR